MRLPETGALQTPPNDLQRVDRLCDDFEWAWRTGATPTLEEFLSQVAAAIQPDAFVELLHLDLAYRRGKGMTPTPAEYLARFPEFGDSIRKAFDSLAGSTLAPRSTPSPSPPPPAEFPPQIGDYELIGELGRGGMGVVFRARQVSLDRLVALKVIRGDGIMADEYVRRFQSEARAAGRLHHPGIVQVYDVGRDGPYHFFSMQLIEGTTLAERFEGALPTSDEAAELLSHVAAAVHAAHESGILHRDLKPSNILIDRSGHVRIADFGLAKLLAGAETLTGTGQVLGTPGYMAPEQARGEQERIDRRCDIYSLGAVLYALLTGRPPFRGRSPIDTLVQVVHESPRPPHELNPAAAPALERICLKCLAKDPEDRYQTAELLRAEMQRFLTRASADEDANHSSIAGAAAAVPHGSSAGTRRIGLVVGMVAVGSVVIAMASALSQRGAGNRAADLESLTPPISAALTPADAGDSKSDKRPAAPARTEPLLHPGAPDPTFGKGGMVQLPVGQGGGVNDAYAVALQQDGKIVVAGQSTRARGTHYMALTRHLPDGRLDPSFNTTGKLVLWLGAFDDGVTGRALLIQPDGRIVFGGRGEVTSIRYDFSLVRLNENGTFDESFGRKGVVTTNVAGYSTSYLQAMALQPDGKIVAAGNAMTSDTEIVFALVRYLPDGTLDPTFGRNGQALVNFPGATEEVTDMAIRDDGRIAWAGRAGEPEKVDAVIMVQNPDGTPDAGFGTEGRVSLDFHELQESANHIHYQGRNLLVQVGNGKDHLILRLTSDGRLDPTFGPDHDGIVRFESEFAGFVLSPEGKIIVAHGARHQITVLSADGLTLESYGTNQSLSASENDARPVLRDLVLAPDGKIVFCGNVRKGGPDCDWLLLRVLGPPSNSASGPDSK